MNSNERIGDDHEFDRLLGRAQWPEPSVEQIERLHQRWHSTRRRRRLLVRCGTLAAAASLLVAAGILAWHDTAAQPQMTPVAKTTAVADAISQSRRATVAQQRPPAPPLTISPATRPKPSRSPAEPRDPNLYEQVVLMSVFGDRGAKSQTPARQQLVDRTIEELIVVLSQDAKVEVGDRLAVVRSDLARCERLLWDNLARETGARRVGAARLLARIGTARSVPVLLDLANDPETHGAAILGLGRLADTRRLAQLASVERDTTCRRELLTMFLERRTDESVELYLGFVDQPGSRTDSLVALTATADPPVNLLLGFLEAPQRPLRLAAARALARLPDPQVARQLSGSVLQGIGRQEALVALLLSRTSLAESILNEARQSLYLVASVRAAEQELHSLTNLERR